jgi:hypothetical protein
MTIRPFAFGALFLLFLAGMACGPLVDVYFVNCSGQPVLVKLMYRLPKDTRVLFSGTVPAHDVLRAEKVIPFHPVGHGVRGQEYRIIVSRGDGPAVESDVFAEELARRHNVFAICDCR